MQASLRQTKIHLICSGVPPDVALVMAHAASFLVLNSAFCKISIRTGKMLASITVWRETENESIVMRDGAGAAASRTKHTFYSDCFFLEVICPQYD